MIDIYYAHHQWKYGTKVERYEYDLIKRYFPNAKVFDPSTMINTEGLSEDTIMDICLQAVTDSDVVIFSSMDSCIGKGVYTEILKAESLGKLILYIYQDKLHTDWSVMLNTNSTADRIYAFIKMKGEK